MFRERLLTPKPSVQWTSTTLPSEFFWISACASKSYWMRISDDYEVSHSYVYYRWPDQTPTPPLVWVLANVFLWVLGSFLHTCHLYNLEMPHQDISLINLPLILVCKTFSLRCSPLLSPEDHFNSPFQGNLCIPCSVLIVTSGAVYCSLVIF